MAKKQITIRYTLLSSWAHAPSYVTEHSSGLDLHAAIERPLSLRPGQHRLVPTGLALEIPPGYEGQVRPRSGLALKYGISVLNAPGTIDADYRGEVGVILVNLGRRVFTVNPGDRIAQLVISPVVRVSMFPTEVLKQSGRGRGGFGHTGFGCTPVQKRSSHK